MPIDGVLREMIYVPGDLFSVNPLTAENVPGLFARNERVVCIFDTPVGPMTLTLVGATIVASIETIWAGTITPPHGKQIHRQKYPSSGQGAVTLKKGDEMGRFKLGSTVVLTFAKGAISLHPSNTPGTVTQMGTAFASALSKR
jgi:phosphatidylserine decarboxylase